MKSLLFLIISILWIYNNISKHIICIKMIDTVLITESRAHSISIIFIEKQPFSTLELEPKLDSLFEI